MRRTPSVAILAVCLTLAAGSALAQDENFIFGEYYICDQNREAMADVLVEHVIGPLYQAQVDAGNLTGWGWLAHRVGGDWRRLLFSTGTDLEKMFTAREAIIAAHQNDITEESRAFTDICSGHDDLIWNQAAGPAISQQLGNLGDFSYSTYYYCNVAKQERADEIVRDVIGPAADALVQSGELNGWGWHAHAFGGAHRRLMTHSGMSQAGLMAAVTKYNQEAGRANQAAVDEFSTICGTHDDYMWNRLLPKRDGN